MNERREQETCEGKIIEQVKLVLFDPTGCSIPAKSLLKHMWIKMLNMLNMDSQQLSE